MGIQYLDIKGDGKLVINQMTGVYALKERTLAPYRAEAQSTYYAISAKQHSIGRTENRHADALATLASKLKMKEDEVNIKVVKRTVPVTWLAQNEEKQEQ